MAANKTQLAIVDDGVGALTSTINIDISASKMARKSILF